MTAWLGNYLGSFSFIGLVVATLFFAGSVTPSLLPRPYYVQGVLSGFALAIGYGLGVGSVWFWKFLELPQSGENFNRWSKWITTVCVATIFGLFVWRSAYWQNSIRELMQMEPVETAIVSTQYSCLPSWMTLLIDPMRARQSALHLFEKVYAHWTTLPKETRPKLYLFGLSLGSFGSERSDDLVLTTSCVESADLAGRSPRAGCFSRLPLVSGGNVPANGV